MKNVRWGWLTAISVCGVLLFGGCGGYEEKPYIWDAGSRTFYWKPLAETVDISRAKGVVFLKGSKSSLHISGTAGASGFAESDPFPMDEMKEYSMSAYVKMNEENPASSIPSIVCQFLTSDGKLCVGEVIIPKIKKIYESEQLGKWHIYSSKFQTPLGTEQFKLSVVPSSDSLREASASQFTDMYIDFIHVSASE